MCWCRTGPTDGFPSAIVHHASEEVRQGIEQLLRKSVEVVQRGLIVRDMLHLMSPCEGGEGPSILRTFSDTAGALVCRFCGALLPRRGGTRAIVEHLGQF